MAWRTGLELYDRFAPRRLKEKVGTAVAVAIVVSHLLIPGDPVGRGVAYVFGEIVKETTAKVLEVSNPILDELKTTPVPTTTVPVTP